VGRADGPALTGVTARENRAIVKRSLSCILGRRKAVVGVMFGGGRK